MKFSTSRKAFLAAVSQVKRAAASKSPCPILTHILLRTDGAELLVLQTTDLEIAMTATMPAEITQEGTFTVPVKTLSEMLTAMSEDTVVASSDGKTSLILACGSAKYTLMGLPSSEYPDIPPTVGEQEFSDHAQTLLDAIKSTAPCMSDNKVRMVLCGCCWTWSGDKLTLVTTDTHRLAVKALDSHSHLIDPPISVIIPGRSMAELSKLLNVDEVVQITTNNERIAFTVGNVTLMSRLIEGQFPFYDHVIPPSTRVEIETSRGALLTAVKRAKLIAKTASNAVRFVVDASSITVKAMEKIGSETEEIAADATGDFVDFSLNADYLIDALSVIDADRVVLRMNIAVNPILIGDAKGDGSYTHLIMPMQME